MEPETFFIRSLMVQNGIMAVVAVIVGLLFWRGLRAGNWKNLGAVVLWAAIALWFFNGPLWGFSAVTVSPEGLRLHYGFLSVFKNESLAPDTQWQIHTYMGGLKRMKRLYFFQLARRQSLKVRGADKLEILKSLGAAIDRINGRSMGRMEERPINM